MVFFVTVSHLESGLAHRENYSENNKEGMDENDLNKPTEEAMNPFLVSERAPVLTLYFLSAI